jgi:hypothetical protein
MLTFLLAGVLFTRHLILVDGLTVLAKFNELPDAVLKYCDQFSAEKSPDCSYGSLFDLVI